MTPRIFISLALTLLVAACSTTDGTYSRADGTIAKIYRISERQHSKIQYGMLDSVNTLRQAAGFGPVTLNAQLNAAAATHSRDMSVQNRPWHFGSDGSSPIDRVARTGYPGLMLGEAISETYETELETLSAWMDEPGTRDVILAPAAQNLGFAWHQEPSGKIWWTLLMGS
ncbi:CAP domain-containing protein [Aliiroseovarius crassostreae]|uniref:CAP domain-containing protein n=1 Tax=Aliiroseovarius crassostreae TaxID=154981 RepID=UPI002208BDF9|nr:CAP domain-containing protein [Aliiroseovarius crassostreae]UWQ07858.1 CAP domain-containing protein [Aliiroseovarius crassostreae]UWQ10962.1 CAP domain-containing protein [Aliiroseovarius crassostreae]